MKFLALTAVLLFSSIAFGQDDPCFDNIMKQKGTWKQNKNPESSGPADLPMQKKMIQSVQDMLQKKYVPMGSNLEWAGVYPPLRPEIPVATYYYSLGAFNFLCKDDGTFTMPHETNTGMDIFFNDFTFTQLYDTVEVKLGSRHEGFFELRHGIPVEINKGIWAFPDDREALGFGRTGKNRMWLITYDGQLPWTYVTRKEFLQKRIRTLQMETDYERKAAKEKMADLEKDKKQKEEEYKNDPTRLEKYMKGTWIPMRDNYQKIFAKIEPEYERALELLKEQLNAPESELNKRAIVIRSQKNSTDYSFVDKVEPFALVLVKPNPSYFKKTVPKSIPQFISVEIGWDHENAVRSAFAKGVNDAVDLDFLKSLIGKTTPTVASGKGNAYAPPVQGAGVGPNDNYFPVANAVFNTSTGTPAIAMQASSITPAPQGKPASNPAPAASAANTKTSTSTPAKTSGKGSSIITGHLGSVTGVPVTVSLNNKADVTLTVPKAAGKLHGAMELKFPTQIPNDSPYRVTIKKIASNMVGAVFNGEGKAPNGADKVQVCVDYKYELMSRSSDDSKYNTFYETNDPAIGGMGADEGRYVAFISAGAGLDGADGKKRQVFFRDRNTGTLKMISRSPSGEPGNDDSFAPSVSADGKKVVFESRAGNLILDDKNNARDIFMWDATTNKIERISVGKGGREADAESYEPMISGDGNFVVFTSPASNIADIPKDRSNKNVFLRDLTAGTTTMISVGMGRTGGDGSKPAISFDGSRIAFHSQNTLTADDSSPLWDIYLWQRSDGKLKRITKTHDGKDKDQGEESAARIVAPAISGNGRYISFATTATNMVPGDNNGKQDVFVYDIETGKVTCVSFTDDGKPGSDDSPIEQGDRAAFSHDGTWIVFPTKAGNLGTTSSNIVMHNLVTGKKKIVTQEQGAYMSKPSLSYSASYVVFASGAKIDSRHASSGVFAAYTGLGPCRN